MPSAVIFTADGLLFSLETGIFMTIREDINSAVKDAMRAKDTATLQTLRMLTAALKQIEIDEGIEINDDIAIKELQRQVKQRKDAAAQYHKSDRPDLAEKEEAEIAVIYRFMPAQMSEEEIAQYVDKVFAESGLPATIASMSVLMNKMRPELEGKADLALVGKYLKSKLQ